VFYAHTLADDGIKVNALAPGLRRTDVNASARPPVLPSRLTLDL
jgi:NAD(P)-dependent dehydrogenase (short-subunit alcohol dehydrogenase family)